MNGIGLFVRLEARPGKEREVAEFLREARSMVDAEPGTSEWFALQLGPTTFAIFDTFADENGRQAHLSGRVAETLRARSPELFLMPPQIERAELLAAKDGAAHNGRAHERRRLTGEERIPMQVGSELRITQDGALALGNPEIELARSAEAADVFLGYRFEPGPREHVIRVLAPLSEQERGPVR